MKNQWNIFRSAVMFLTRLPVGKNLPYSPGLLQQTPQYFPLVGIMVGFVVWVAFVLAHLLFNQGISIAISMVAGILCTGAFHEDGFADTCDAFGGGWSKTQILTIMKDSRLGTYGVVGIMGMLGMKFLLLQALLPNYELFPFSFACLLPNANPSFWLLYGPCFCLLLASHAVSRLAAISIIQRYEYVSDTASGAKSKPLASTPLQPWAFGFAVGCALLPFLGLPYFYVLALLPVAFITILLARYFHRWIGGYTGDCLGATQQVAEVVFYAAVIVLKGFAIYFY
ncbi:MAG: adenosylcobinamide-GDP ribazoletransferase [Bacteroidetes bacterium]|nr:MAG: adenosylcobinamide-GDP ribazoletransferase [Bacteroidota bacterium]